MGTPRKTFYMSHEGWYWDANREARAGVMSEIMISPTPAPGCEFAIRWMDIRASRGSVPRLDVFDDAWRAFASDPALLKFLADHDSHQGGLERAPVTPADVSAFLLSAGYVDVTERKPPIDHKHRYVCQCGKERK